MKCIINRNNHQTTLFLPRNYMMSLHRSFSPSLSLLFCVVFLFLISSCKVQRKITQTKPLEEKKVEWLLEKADSSRFRCEWFSAKVSATVIHKDNSSSFTASVRTRKDSVIWLSVSVPLLGIEAGRLLITADTSKMLDRINSKYALTNFNYLNNLLQVSLNIEMLQALMFGNYFTYFDERKLKSSYIDGKNYIISTLRKRKLKRSLEEKEPNKRFIQDTWISPDNFRIVKMVVDDNKTKRELTAVYENFITVDSMQFASKVTIGIDSETPLQLILEYSKVNIDKPQEFPFTIPDKYEKIK